MSIFPFRGPACRKSLQHSTRKARTRSLRRRKLRFENLEYRRLLATISGYLANDFDGDDGNDTSIIPQQVSVVPVNDPPVAQGDEYHLFAGSSLVISPVEGILSNDSDVEGDTLEAILVSGPLGGALTLNDDGSFSYQPNVLYFGSDSFTYQAFDGQAYSDVVAVTLRVDLPTTNPLYRGDVNGDGYLSALDPLLIANYIAVNGIGPLPDDFVVPPFLDHNADGLVNQEDVDGAVARVDQTGPGLLPEPRLEISPAPPTPSSGEMMSVRLVTTDLSGSSISQINAGQSFYLSAWVADRRLAPQGVFAAYVDVFYDISRVAIDGALTHGSEFSKYATGEITIPGLIDETGSGRDAELLDGDEHLLWRVPMRAEARGGAMFDVNSAGQTVDHPMLLFGWDGPIPEDNISFGETELLIFGPPQAEDDVYFAVEDETLEVEEINGVLANDTDDEDDPLTAHLVDAPNHGDVQLNQDGSFAYTPDADYFGTDRFTYRANDGHSDSGVATVLINVQGTDDPPLANDDQYSVFRDELLQVSAALGIMANDAEPDGDPLAVLLVDPPVHGDLVLEADGSFTYMPLPDFGGQDQFRYQINDGNELSNVATVTIDVLFDWQNPLHSVDVNGDGYVTSLDALVVLNDVLVNGSRVLPQPPVPPNTAPPFLDVSGNSIVSTLDGMLVLEDLNSSGPRQLPQPRLELPQQSPVFEDGDQVEFRLEVLAEDGSSATQFDVGDTILVNVYATDLRAIGGGVFSTYLDVEYEADGLLLASAPIFSNAFPNVRQGDTTVPGIVDEVGATVGIAPVGSDVLLLQLAFVAELGGQFQVSTNAADVLPQGDVTVWGVDGPVPQDKILYGSATINVSADDSDADGVGDSVEDAAPNDGDFNSDGIPDRLQGNVASLPTFDGSHYVRFETDVQTPFRKMRAVDNPSPADSPSEVQFEHGFFKYEMTGLAGGASTTAVFRTDGSAAGTLVYSYGSTPDQTAPHWYLFMRTNTSGAMVFSDGIDILYADGERGDHDLATDGTIASVVGIGTISLPWQNPNLAEDVNNSGDVTPVDALILINLINQDGPYSLPPTPTPGLAVPPYLDPSGDNAITAADVLQVITRLNADAAAASAAPEGEAWEPLSESLPESAPAPLTIAPDASTVFVLPGMNPTVSGRQIAIPPSSAWPTNESVQTGTSFGNTELWGTEQISAFSTDSPTAEAERLPLAESSLTDDELEGTLEDIATAVARGWTLS